MNIKKLVACLLALALVLCALPMVFAEVADDAGADASDIHVPVQLPNDGETIYGDANGNGVIDANDMQIILKYRAGWDETLNEEAADVNIDGEINCLDAILVGQYCEGWDVVLGEAA